MLIEQNIDKFIELRAQGWTLAHIATELHVSKRTLVDWNREYAADIQSLCTAELELLQEKFAATYKAAGGDIQFQVFEGCEHEWVATPGPQTDRAREMVRAFIARNVKA